MKFKNTLAGLVSVSIMSLSAVTAFAADAQEPKIISTGQGEIIPIRSELPKPEQAKFIAITGTVQKITEREGMKGSKFISVETEKEEPANIIVTEDTYIAGNTEIEEGHKITWYYDTTKPMIMIYPPQYLAEVVIVGDQEKNIRVDIFDKDLVSTDNSLKLNLLDETEIISHDGNEFEGELEGRKLAVFYAASTKSIPAQTSPDKIVVLPDTEEPATEDTVQDASEEILPIMGDVSAMDIIVNNEKAEAPSAYTNDQGTLMVPLRPIAEALGFEVNWNDQLQSIMLDKDISLKLGEDNYINAKNAPIQLGASPELVEGTTYVPLIFFRKVAQMNNAYVFEAQIVIDNGEKMQ